MFIQSASKIIYSEGKSFKIYNFFLVNKNLYLNNNLAGHTVVYLSDILKPGKQLVAGY